MNDARTVVLRLLGIALLAALFCVGIRSDRAPESPFQQVAHRLRVGMSSRQCLACLAEMKIGGPGTVEGSPTRYLNWWRSDPEHHELLVLHFEIDELQQLRLTEWNVVSVAC
jgi:hypothetical protein